MDIKVGDRIKYVIKYKGDEESRVVDIIITGTRALFEIKKWINAGDIRVIKIEKPIYQTKFYWKDLSEKEKIELTTEWNRRANETRIKRLQEEKNKNWIERFFDWW